MRALAGGGRRGNGRFVKMRADALFSRALGTNRVQVAFTATWAGSASPMPGMHEDSCAQKKTGHCRGSDP
ncbi:protein of unknown function [Desulfovibrio sp. 86]|nr:protein of unknown function [Desulfovibrio sp. 86]